MPVSAPRGRRAWPWLLLSLLCSVLPAASAHGRQRRSALEKPTGESNAARERVKKATVQGAQAAEKRDFATAYTTLAEAYREYPNAETLYQLGMLAQAEGRSLAAQDLLRRYLADPSIDAHSESHGKAQRIVAEPRPPSGELQVEGEQGTLVLIDGKVVGVLPLGLPLLLSSGEHQVGLETAGRLLQNPVQVSDGRTAELRFHVGSKAFLLTVPPALLVVPEYGALSAELPARVQSGYERAARRVGLSLYREGSATKALSEVAECLDAPSCLERLARRLSVDYVLRVKLAETAPGGGSSAPSYRAELALFDPETGEVAARQQPSCASCGPEEVAQVLVTACEQVIAEGQARERGRIVITSEPPGAAILRDAAEIGRTPYERAAFAGPFPAELRLPGYLSERMSAVVQGGKRTELRVALRAEPEPEPAAVVAPPKPPPPPSPLSRLPRPTWRLALGSALIGSGLLVGGFGVSALIVDGKCSVPPRPPSVCPTFYDTRIYGETLLPAGIGLGVVGVVLLAIPGPRPAARPPD
jgi:hypothetical protein